MKRLLALTPALALLASPAMAHHPLGGLPMETFGHGILSGVGHPVLGFDHLAFVIVMGLAAAFTPARTVTPMAYIAAMLAGCVMVASGVGLPAKEMVIVASLLLVGGIVASGRAMAMTPALVLFAGFGLFHGAAFGGSIAGQEGGVGGAVFAGYLIGLAATQYLIALTVMAVTRFGLRATRAGATAPRLAGAAVFGIGAFLALEFAEGPIVAALAG
ncbi:HupE / UreJ protein [Jannaschia seosinensis]|uniref:HupE / UreJ protein n=1 Tax=Jannaschia seosinensis TaxID=313367 RepID=A0A0M7BCD7_9RHOB|nr:HupE/UreJ family protein [Jannaschia seosinensis]CUH39738.1 HupE / UreJ protein [Jannaschia seosinensis]